MSDEETDNNEQVESEEEDNHNQDEDDNSDSVSAFTNEGFILSWTTDQTSP